MKYIKLYENKNNFSKPILLIVNKINEILINNNSQINNVIIRIPNNIDNYIKFHDDQNGIYSINQGSDKILNSIDSLYGYQLQIRCRYRNTRMKSITDNYDDKINSYINELLEMKKVIEKIKKIIPGSRIMIYSDNGKIDFRFFIAYDLDKIMDIIGNSLKNINR